MAEACMQLAITSRAFVVPASSVGAAAKSDVHTARAPETLKFGVEFVFAFFSRTRRPGMLGAVESNPLYIPKIKLNGSICARGF